MLATALAPLAGAKSLEKSVWYAGNLVSVIVPSAATDGAFSVFEVLGRPGGEPPMHVHEFEDEAIYLLDGQIEFTVGGTNFRRQVGEMIFMPRGIPHTFRVLTPVARVLGYLTPGGFENFFVEAGSPARKLEMPEVADHGPEFFERVLRIAPKFGLRMAV